MMPLRSLRLIAVAASFLATSSAFVLPQTPKPALVRRQALWRHFVKRHNDVWDPETTNLVSTAKNGFLSSCFALVLVIPIASLAVSGGGLDFANLDITGQDFSNGNYKGKDFTQVRTRKSIVSISTTALRAEISNTITGNFLLSSQFAHFTIITICSF
jgi:uncharacterized protein YjbI with pentapeptide repeats